MKTEEHSFNEEHMANKVKDTGFSGRIEITESIGQQKKKLELQVLNKRDKTKENLIQKNKILKKVERKIFNILAQNPGLKISRREIDIKI